MLAMSLSLPTSFPPRASRAQLSLEGGSDSRFGFVYAKIAVPVIISTASTSFRRLAVHCYFSVDEATSPAHTSEMPLAFESLAVANVLSLVLKLEL
jgi:hypothetical protein